MTWISTYNNGTSSIGMLIDHVNDIFFLMKEILVNHDGASGQWSVVMSGDGLSAYSATGDVITHTETGAGGFDNNGAWYVLEDPSGAQYLFSKSTYQYYFLWYCKAGDFAGGNATTKPTGTGVVGLTGVTTNVAAIEVSNTVSEIMHMVVSDTAINGAWPFWFLTRVPGSGGVGNIGLVDCVTEASAPNDADPRVFLWSSNFLKIGTGSYIGNTNVSSLVYGYMQAGLPRQEWERLCYLHSVTITNGIGVVLSEGKPLILDVPVCRAYGSQIGVKGISSVIKFCTTKLDYGAIVSNSVPEYYLPVDEILLSGWTGPTLPLI